MEVTIWRAKGSEFLSEWLIDHTTLKAIAANGQLTERDMPASDASNPKQFFRMPARLKEILYLEGSRLNNRENHCEGGYFDRSAFF